MTGSHTDGLVQRVPSFAVHRGALVDRFDRALRKRLVLLVAPAGYGKSVLLGQWAAANPDRRVLWTEARATDDAVAFGRRLVRALGAVAPGAPDRIPVIPGSAVSTVGEDVLEAVGAELAAVAPVVVAIEDLETLASADLRRQLGALACRTAPGVTFVLASRDDRFPGIEPLRLRDEVVEIRQSALAFTCDEVVEVVARMGGPELSPPAAVALHSRTEGWAAGVQLAALGLRDHEDPGAFVADFAGDDRHVADYLSGEVLARLPDDITDFLVATAVLDRLNGSLCDAITGRTDGQRMLELLDGQSLFVTPLDRRRDWFAYHPLFRDLLRHELRAERPGEEQRLLTLAAAWHREQGQLDDAAQCLVRSGDWSALIEFSNAEGGPAWERGDTSSVARWLEQVPLERLMADPDAVLVLAGLLTICGRTVAAEAFVDRVQASAELDVVQQAEVACLRAMWATFHAPPDTAFPAAAYVAGLEDHEMERQGGPLLAMFSPAGMRSMTVGSAAVVRSMATDHAEARRLLAQLEASPGAPVWLVHALAELAWIDISTGHVRRGLGRAARALEVAEAAGVENHPATGMAHLTIDRGLRVRGEHPDVDHLALALARGRLNGRHRVLSTVWVEQVHAAFAERRLDDGLTLVDRAEVSGGPPWPQAEQARLVALKARIHVLAGDHRAARRALDGHDGLVTAELAGSTAMLTAAEKDLPGLRKVVEAWPEIDLLEPHLAWTRDLWAAVLLDLEGDRRGAVSAMGPVVDAAASEGVIRPFLDGGVPVQRLVRARYHDHPTPFLRRLVETAPPSHGRTYADLVEHLTERELEVLRYLPSRLSNAEIAAKVYVSLNTVKTHVKNIYRKLEVGDRGAAIERAEELGLL
jgi:LuxR family maltose regulon positive regulatory protein